MGQTITPGLCPVAIIGTGPYGLSLAAHLRARGIAFRIFGKPMDAWRRHMPVGMKLKSPGFASSLSAPDSASRLSDFCRQTGRPYADQDYPVPLEDFVAYGDWFRARHVPDIEETLVTHLDRDADGLYTLALGTGERLRARHVVLATGITDLARLPPELAHLPEHLVSHSYDHRSGEAYRGRSVVVVGAGASAVNLADELRACGASVTLLARSAEIHYAEPPSHRSRWQKILNPASPIGQGWRSLLCALLPGVLYRLDKLRHRAIRAHMRPAAGWFMRDKVLGKVPALRGWSIVTAQVEDGRVRLNLSGAGNEMQVTCDHVVAATGYPIALDHQPYLSEGLRRDIARTGASPRLSARFETSLPGLFAVGPLAMESFGPVLRFVAGAEYACPRLARTLHIRLCAAQARQSLGRLATHVADWALPRDVQPQ